MYNKKCQGPFRSSCSIVLASGSPRRRVLLRQLGLSFSVCTSKVHELDDASGFQPDQLTKQNAILKLEAAKDLCSADVIICADTCVYCNSKIFGKPIDFQQAVEMLSQLSGRWHEVYTSFVIFRKKEDKLRKKTVTSRVYLDTISSEVLHAYCSSEEPYDKAGGYAVQGSGAFLVRKIEGSYTNVVGLPITELVKDLLELRAIEPCANV